MQRLDIIAYWLAVGLSTGLLVLITLAPEIGRGL